MSLQTMEDDISAIPAERLVFIEHLIARGGPEAAEYEAFTAWIDAMADDVSTGTLSVNDLRSFWRQVTQHAFKGTAQADVVLQPHGYHGDFEIIDAIYTERVNEHPALEKWDRYFHAQSAPKAVRNRKAYFQHLLRRSEDGRWAQHRTSVDGHTEPGLRVLNVASGPGRDMHEWFESSPKTGVRIDCVELDPKAIRYASELCAKWMNSIQFHQGNALRFKTGERYHLIWSAGLFDYLNDALFVRLLRTFLRHCLPGGEIVVGNFSEYNPSRNYMELLGGWELIHRSRERLVALSELAGIPVEHIHVGQEEEGVNLFLHIRVPSLLKS